MATSKQSSSCPIRPEVVDEPSARLGAALVILAAGLALGSGAAWVALLLAADFALRSRGLAAFSPIGRASRWLRAASGLAPRPVNAGPKRFAALVGVVFSLGLALALFLHHRNAALAVAGILIGCAALEAFLGYCLGCKVYGLLQRLPRPRTLEHT